jgi:hypothetical protein
MAQQRLAESHQPFFNNHTFKERKSTLDCSRTNLRFTVRELVNEQLVVYVQLCDLSRGARG